MKRSTQWWEAVHTEVARALSCGQVDLGDGITAVLAKPGERALLDEAERVDELGTLLARDQRSIELDDRDVAAGRIADDADQRRVQQRRVDDGALRLREAKRSLRVLVRALLGPDAAERLAVLDPCSCKRCRVVQDIAAARSDETLCRVERAQLLGDLRADLARTAPCKRALSVEGVA
jgi:hypothetical protein